MFQATVEFLSAGMKICVVGALATLPLWAGQSLRLNGSQTVTNDSVAAQPNNGACRLEFQLTFPAVPSSPNVGHVNACGLYLQFSGTTLAIYPDNTTGWSCCYTIQLAGLASNWVMVRFQIIPAGAGGTLTWQAWDINGAPIASHVETYTNTIGPHSNGAYVGSTIGQDNSWGFFRLSTTTLPIGSREPTFADSGDLLDWKFNNSLSDSSSHHYNGSGVSPSSLCGSAPCYEATLGQGLVTAVIKTNPAPVWSNFQSWRAGATVGLDGSASISMGDSSSAPTVEWQILSGPSTPIWSSHTAMKPTLTGIVFGNYRVQLVATNSNGGSATTVADIGAVAYDDNGVVIPADPNVTKIFGPQIAFGQNPWGYADERSFRAINLQIASNPYYASATWLTTGQGTVAYPFAGKGSSPGQSCTILSSGISATATSIPVANASCLSLSSLPTTILIGPWPQQEAIRICSATGASGAQTLTTCYDGRGIASTANGNAGTVQAQAWSTGATVGEYRIQGTGTLFATDSQRPLCPAGAPGPMGGVTYSTGSVQLAPSSTTVTGIGTTWNSGNGVVAGYNIRVTATHGGGTPFVWWAKISTVAGNTSITANRPAPSDVDAATNFSYKITGVMYLSLEFSDSNNTYRAIQNGVYCESETAAFGLLTHDMPAFNATNQTGQKFSYKLGLGAASAFGPNFYGTGLAARAFYYRSGWEPALTLANQIDENWTRDPEICGGLCGGAPLLLGGGAIGGIADKILNTSTALSWYDVTGWAMAGIAYSTHPCNQDDQRDSSYPLSWNALLGLFDPDPARHATWLAGLATWAAREEVCRRRTNEGYSGVAVNSWASAANFNAGQFSSSLTLVNGSNAIAPTTPHGLVAGMCAGVDDGSGTITVTKGVGTATVASGSVVPGGVRIWITDTTSSPLYSAPYAYSGSGGTGSTITLGALWPGASGTFHFMVEGNSLGGNYAAIGIDQSDTFANNSILQETWACHYTDSDHAQLHRPWDNSNGSAWKISVFNVEGFETQPFMLGIKATAMNWASNVSDPTISANFASLLPAIGNWMNTYGTDPAGAPYTRVMQACEPIGTPTPGTTFLTTHGGGDGYCGLSGLYYLPSAEANDRAHNAEAGTAMLSYYLASPSPATRSAVDTFYGQVFGYCPYTQGGGSTFYCDANYVNTSNELSDGSLGSFKWPGFFFGMGGFFSNSWPAVRVGGVPPGVPRTLSVSCNISSVANATKCRVTLTKPDGSAVSNTCTTSPCAVTADGRQGDHLLKVEYLSASDAVLASGDSQPVKVN